MKYFIWALWGLVTLALASYYGYTLMVSENKSSLLIGDTSYGHYQIEMACATCHSDPFGDADVLQDACMNCHREELENANDSHPKSKFTNPRNADRVAILDARYCVTCHTEHQRDKTLAMGLTQPADVCFHCHRDIAKELPSHKDLGFDTCASAGCHNFHDNRALYEDFLVEHAHEPWLVENAIVAAITGSNKTEPAQPLLITEHDATSNHVTDTILQEWHDSAHSRNGVNCSDCHEDDEQQWLDKPGIVQCRNCHAFQAKTYVEGKHGMRLASTLSQPLTVIHPRQSANLEFQQQAMDREQDCNSCHTSHRFDRNTAAVDACLSCHSDQHSVAYQQSPHATLWQRELAGTSPSGSGVSCATCHMPRETHIHNGENIVQVQHNQNLNLRPNEKMIRSVCLNCHGLEFTIDALADTQLIQQNFAGKPARHIRSIDMALERVKEKDVH